MPELSNWGNYPRIQADLLSVSSDEEAVALLRERSRDGSSLIPRGLGRCYGDSALAPMVLSLRERHKLLELDTEKGIVTCEAGVSLDELLTTLVPRGWFLPVVPGTKHVTVGGAIASDVHGKSHHRDGTFSRHVLWMDLLTPEGRIQRLWAPGSSPPGVETGSQASNDTLFRATAGGMGLTGIILRAGLRLVPVETAYLRTETLVARDLTEAMALFRESAAWTYSVAWIDCQARGSSLGRSILYRGEHATAGELTGPAAEHPLEEGWPLKGRAPSGPRRGLHLRVPFFLPPWTLNALTIRAFNTLYFRTQAWGAGESLTGYDPFFFPLDAVENWNRIYGRRGFLQYQMVLPLAESETGVAAILERIAASGLGSFLAVLKLMGKGGGPGREMLSFPMEGYTLALDFPASRRAFHLLEELDALVLRHGGRLYLTKDARMSRTMMDEGYPDVEAFRALRREVDPRGVLSSLQAQRLGL